MVPSTKCTSTKNLCNWLRIYVEISIDWSVDYSPSTGNRNSPIPLRETMMMPFVPPPPTSYSSRSFCCSCTTPSSSMTWSSDARRRKQSEIASHSMRRLEASFPIIIFSGFTKWSGNCSTDYLKFWNLILKGCSFCTVVAIGRRIRAGISSTPKPGSAL